MKVRIEFTQEVKYNFEAELTKEQFELIKDLYMDDVPMYIKKPNSDRLIINPQHEVLENFLSPKNIQDEGEELLDVTVEEL